MKVLTKTWAAAIGILIVMGLVGGYWLYWSSNFGKGEVVKVFCAGSLTLPLEEIEAAFERDHPDVDVQIEPSGSVMAVQKITESEKRADVLASADYTLIPGMMMPDYADWSIRFAKNRMVLTYAEGSLYADQINSSNWHEILQREGVRWAFANPNMDPCGYRTIMAIQLAELEYGDDMIFERLVVENTAITVVEENGKYRMTTPEELSPNADRLKIRDKSVELISMLQEGGVDYAWEYISVAKQHGLSFTQLPETVDLSSVSCAAIYGKVEVQTTSKKVSGRPIVYGATVPKNALNTEYGEEFLMYMINGFGQNVFISMGQPPIVPAVTEDLDVVPERLRPYLVEY